MPQTSQSQIQQPKRGSPQHRPQLQIPNSPLARTEPASPQFPKATVSDRPQPLRQYPTAPNSPVRPNSARNSHARTNSTNSLDTNSIRSRKTPPVTVEDLELARKRATTLPQDNAVQLAYARTLIQASECNLASQYSDPVTVSNEIVPEATSLKTREVWQSLAAKIVKRLATRAVFPDAMFVYGTLCSSGSCGLATDNAKAFELYEKAARLDHPEACYRVAVCFEFAVGTTRNFERAVHYYEQAAKLGNAGSMYKLAMISLRGALGQPRDFKTGFLWLQKAAQRADEKNPHALHELGLLYEHSQLSSYTSGDPVPLNTGQAAACFRSAATQGYAPAQLRLARAYEYGELQLAINPAESYFWYLQAAQQDDSDAQLGLAGWYWTGSPSLRKNDSEAFMWAERAATAGNVRALFCLGYFYESGVGVRPDLEKARLWYTRAAQRKHAKAAQRLLDPVFA